MTDVLIWLALGGFIPMVYMAVKRLYFKEKILVGELLATVLLVILGPIGGLACLTVLVFFVFEKYGDKELF